MSEKDNLETLPTEAVAEEVAPIVEEVKAEEPVKVEPIVVEEAKPVKAEEKPKKAAKEEKAVEAETVALHSTRPVFWEGIGRLEKGYNLVSKAQSVVWLERSHVRLATPEEIKGAISN